MRATNKSHTATNKLHTYTHDSHLLMREGVRVRSACTALLYNKVLKMSLSEVDDVGAGRITNIMSTDLKRIELMYGFLVHIVFGPLQIIVCIVLLVGILDAWSAFGGLLVMISTMPVQIKMFLLLSKFTKRGQGQTDKRVQLSNELLAGIRYGTVQYCHSTLPHPALPYPFKHPTTQQPNNPTTQQPNNPTTQQPYNQSHQVQRLGGCLLQRYYRFSGGGTSVRLQIPHFSGAGHAGCARHTSASQRVFVSNLCLHVRRGADSSKGLFFHRAFQPPPSTSHYGSTINTIHRRG